jgi:hypothetical protein
MFNDMCDRIDVSFEVKLKAFFTMLKRLALNYYYAKMINKIKNHSITFDDVCVSMMNYFENVEYKRSLLNKWNNLSLKSVMNRTENEEKSMNEYLQLLIKELRHLQHDLESILRIDDFIHNKLVNACQKCWFISTMMVRSKSVYCMSVVYWLNDVRGLDCYLVDDL